MSLQINRRSFLQALIAVGAAYALPAKATKKQIDQVWEDAQANPWIFEVDENGTLLDEDVNENAVWEDFFGDRSSDFKTVDSVLDEAERCAPLGNFLNEKLQDEVESLEVVLASGYPALTNNEAAALQEKIDTYKGFLNEYDEPFRGWIELEDDAGIKKFSALVAKWLQEPVDWNQSETFPVRSGSQGAALGFFEDQPYDLLKALGVVIIDGEHPGSSYYAAELRMDIDEANATAEKLGLPFRFKREST